MRHLPLVTAALIAGAAQAQQSAPAAQQATIQNVVVQGTDDILSELVQAVLGVGRGTPVASLDLAALRQAVLDTGFFASAQLSVQPLPGGQALVVVVTQNPTVTAVEFEGLTGFDAEALRRALAQNFNIEAGAIVNQARLDESAEQIALLYRQNGFPFTPAVRAEQVAGPGGVRVRYTVAETAPVSRVEVTGVTLIPAATVQAAFRPLQQAGQFTPQAYQQALADIRRAYTEGGYTLAGVDVERTALEGGVLRVVVSEVTVASVDTAALGTLPAGVALLSRTGTVVNLNNVTQDARTLSNALGRSVSADFRADPAGSRGVVVVFLPGEASAGPVRQIRIVGNTLVPEAEIRAALQTRAGDVFTPLGAQSDYLRIQRLYNARGFEISTRDPIAYQDGVLTFTVREVRLAGYTLQWRGGRVTDPRVVTRGLPQPGALLNTQTLIRSLGALNASGPVRVLDFGLEPEDGNPENVRAVLLLEEAPAGEFAPAISYDTLGGLSADVSYANRNVGGLGHVFRVGAAVGANDAGQRVTGSISYTIPWLDIDFLDFRTNRTGLTFGAFSNVSGNVPLRDAAGLSTGREYTVRSTGVSASVDRQLTPTVAAGVNFATTYNQNYLERRTAGQEEAIGDEAARPLVPPAGLANVLSGTLNYSTVTNALAPDSGVRAFGSLGYGFGREGEQRLNWLRSEAGASTYIGLGNTLPTGDRQQVLAFRVNAGSIAGAAPSSQIFSLGGSSANPAYQLRGYPEGQFSGTTYLTSSAEYRYNTGLLASGLGQGIFGVAFVDVGDAWTNNFAPKVGLGVGVQANLNIGGFGLPPLRLDYSFSPQNSSGRFTFRLGGFF